MSNEEIEKTGDDPEELDNATLDQVQGGGKFFDEADALSKSKSLSDADKGEAVVEKELGETLNKPLSQIP